MSNIYIVVKVRKTALVIGLSLVFLLSNLFVSMPYPPAYSAPKPEAVTTLRFQQDSPHYYINDIQQDPMDNVPLNRWNRLFLLIRYVVESLPLTKVTFTPANASKPLHDGKYGIVIVETSYTQTPRKIEFFINYHQYRMNGLWYPIEDGNPSAVPFISNGRTFLPLRKSGDILEAKDILWDASKRTATLVFRDRSQSEIKELKKTVEFSPLLTIDEQCGSMKPLSSMNPIDRIYSSIFLEDTYTDALPGEPVMPHQTVSMDIPLGWEVQSITCKPLQTEKVDGIFILDSGQIPLNHFQESWEATSPNPEIYSSPTPYPLDLLSNTMIQQNSDQQRLMFSLSPVQYFPSQKTLSYTKKIDLTVTIKKTSEPFEIGRAHV